MIIHVCDCHLSLFSVYLLSHANPCDGNEHQVAQSIYRTGSGFQSLDGKSQRSYNITQQLNFARDEISLLDWTPASKRFNMSTFITHTLCWLLR